MSGIAAVLYRDGRKAAQSDLERIAGSLRAYGPERRATRVVGRVGFAYTHFTDTPEARGAIQPVTGGGGRYVMVFDGRLDNRDEVAADLAIDRGRLVLMSDAALAMAGWERWGEDVLSRWVGEFALIVWDKNEAQLTAARDHFGARTLHFASNADRIIIASAPKGVHALGDLPREIDEQKIADALSQLYHDGERTFFKGVHRIPVGGLITVTETDVKVRKYYSLRDNVRPIHYKKDADYVEAGLELLDQSVRALLRSTRPVGAFMSGGLDSSSMSVLAAEHLAERGKKLITYTSVPESGWDGHDAKGLFGDESPYVKEIGTQIPAIEINLVDGGGMGHYHKQEELLLHLEMPVRNALNLQWTHAILERAKARGVGVMLQGTFGNATLTHLGDGVFGELLKRGSFLQLYKELTAISATPRQLVTRTFKHLVFPTAPQWVWDAKERLRGRRRESNRWKDSACIATGFSEEMNIPERVEAARYVYESDKPGYSRAHWYNVLENWITETGDIMQGLRAIYGIEVRDPFADRRLVEWSFGVPETQFHRMGTNRWLIRRMMSGKLPRRVVDNKKFGHQTADWHVRLTRDLPKIRRDLELWEKDKDISRMLDFEQLRELIDNWPEQSVTDHKDDRFSQLQITLPMAMQVARFVQREKGSNLT